jgi:hypothetical protein
MNGGWFYIPTFPTYPRPVYQSTWPSAPPPATIGRLLLDTIRAMTAAELSELRELLAKSPA